MADIAIAIIYKSDSAEAGRFMGETGLHGTNDYAIYRTDSQLIYNRLYNGDDFTGDLDGQGNVNSLDFSIEDNRLWVRLSTNKAGDKIEGYADGTYEPINIIAQCLNPDKTANNTYNGSAEVVVKNPNGNTRYVECTFTNGKLTAHFVPRKSGIYEIHQVEKNGAKLEDPLKIKVYHKAVSI